MTTMKMMVQRMEDRPSSCTSLSSLVMLRVRGSAQAKHSEAVEEDKDGEEALRMWPFEPLRQLPFSCQIFQ